MPANGFAMFVSDEEMTKLNEELQDLLDSDEGLNDWSVNFIDVLCNWEGNFTQPQAKTLRKIWNRRFGFVP